MKIDIHVHVTPPDIIRDWEKIAEKEPYFRLLSESPVNKFASAEDIAAAVDEDGFDRAVIFGFGFQDMGLCRYVNDYVIEKAREFPDKLIGFSAVLPQHPEVERESAVTRPAFTAWESSSPRASALPWSPGKRCPLSGKPVPSLPFRSCSI